MYRHYGAVSRGAPSVPARRTKARPLWPGLVRWWWWWWWLPDKRFAAIVADLSINAFIARKDWMRFIAFAVYRVVGVVEPLARAC